MTNERWAGEKVPVTDLLFIRVHRQWIRDDEVVPGFFRNNGEGVESALSTDWCKYSTSEECRKRAKNPSVNRVGRMKVGEVLKIPRQSVAHTPIQNNPKIPDNRAHTDVRGSKKESALDIQDHFASICRLDPLPEGWVD